MTPNIYNNKISFLHIARVFILSACMLVVFSATTHARNKATASPLPAILNLYYEVKNALVASDAATASKKAGEMLTVINAVDAKTLSTEEQTVFSPLKDKLSFDARHISEVKDISHQREHFANLSVNMFTLAKGVKLSAQPVYQDYCPMKKAYWLSNEQAIKNPYYGSQMLTCGSIKNTIQ
jgi:hypothetical protein